MNAPFLRYLEINYVTIMSAVLFVAAASLRSIRLLLSVFNSYCLNAKRRTSITLVLIFALLLFKCYAFHA